MRRALPADTEQKPRLFITGAAGAGKTELGRRLAKRFAVPHIELDTGPPEDGIETAPGWIVEGATVWDVKRFLDAADIIVWLDLPLRYTLPRIVRRHLRLSLLRRNPHRGLRLLWAFLRSQPDYHTAPYKEPEGPADWTAHTRANHAAVIESHDDCVVLLRSPRATRSWLRQYT